MNIQERTVVDVFTRRHPVDRTTETASVLSDGLTVINPGQIRGFDTPEAAITYLKGEGFRRLG